MLYRYAFFVSPGGEIIKVKQSHIAYVIEHPDLFGWTYREISSTYQKHREQVGFEGKARHEILIQIIKKGWIRIRQYKSFWSITVNSLTEATRLQLKKWADFIADNPDAPVKILVLETNTECGACLKDLAGNRLSGSA
jgi:hypothetical protein